MMRFWWRDHLLHSPSTHQLFNGTRQRKGRSALGVLICLLTVVTLADSIDLPSWISTGISGIGYVGQAGWTATKTKACSALGRECCMAPFVAEPKGAIRDLQKRLREEFFGQHLAAQLVVNALESHLRDDNPSKALVLSFHGWAGSGKTYLAEQIMKALYTKGADSSFVRFYMASYHFPDSEKVIEYQEMLKKEIRETVDKCERALFVFDEVDKTPPGVFDALVPYIHHPGEKFENGRFKESIFIFISNSGANDITRITFEAWNNGRRREDLTFVDFEKYLSHEAFNKKNNGLYRSRVIDKILVDFYVPFLPMQRDHVISCAQMEGRRLGLFIDAENIADGLAYWPPVEKLYSQTGCKKVESLVKFYLAEQTLNEEQESEEKDEL